MTSRSLVTLVEPGSCFAGPLAEILFAVDRSYMADGKFEGDSRPVASITLTDASFGLYLMSNDLTRLETRFLGEPESVANAKARANTVNRRLRVFISRILQEGDTKRTDVAN